MDFFGGLAAAQDLLATNGFVVGTPDFHQIFEPYIESPLPVPHSIIVFDSPETFHFLVKGSRQMSRLDVRITPR